MTTRRDFLVAGAVAAVVPAVASAATPKPGVSAAALAFDVVGFNALLDKEAQHKHLFASVRADYGEVLSAMRSTLNAYSEIGIPASQVRPVAVFYHGASIALGFNDAMWNRYFLPLARSKSTAAGHAAEDLAAMIDAKTHGNPCMKRQGGERDSSIPALIADADAHFFVCNNAALGFSDLLSKITKTKATDVYQQLTQNLVPNAILVPAGVWAVHAIQQREYTLLQTSL